jgi:hypothetical protein
MAREVDRLLRQLPGADPSLKGDPEPSPQAGRLQMTGPRPAARPAGPPRPEPIQVWGVWGRLAGAAVLGGALTQWPYPAECGWGLYGYMAAVGALLLAAGWTAVAAWRFRLAWAHALALVVGFWGVVLAAEQILPRVGYAAERRYASCATLRAAQAARAAQAERAAAARRAAVVEAPTTADSGAADSASAGGTAQPQRVGRER